MREILPSQLWLGNAMDARNLRRVYNVGIRALVDLAIEESAPQILSRELLYLRIPITDSSLNAPKILTVAIETTASLIRQSIPTLVACSAFTFNRGRCIGAGARSSA